MAIVLAYHRVGQGTDGWWGMRVSEPNFAEHLEVLRRDWEPCTLEEALAPPRRLPDRRVAVTFDDGYADNLTTAAPMMLEAGVPGHLFVATGFMENRQGYWWDALADARHELFPSDGPEGFDRDAFVRTWDRLRRCSPDERASALRTMMPRFEGGAGPGVEPPLGADGIRAIRQMGFTIGAHSVSHPLLPALPAAAVLDELRESRRALEAILNEPIDSFAYPFGQGSRAIGWMLRGSGFRSGFTTDRGTVSGDDSPFLLPRVSVQQWDGATLARLLDFTAREGLFRCGAGEAIRIPLEYQSSNTGRLDERGVRCEAGLHPPGHCLFGASVRAGPGRAHKVRFHFEEVDPERAPRISGEVYLPSHNKLVAGRTVSLIPADRTLDLSFRASKGVLFEPRVYWHGEGRVRITGIELVHAWSDSPHA